MAMNPIRTESDYQRALKQAEQLMAADRGTPEGDKLDQLTALIEAFESKHYSSESLDSLDRTTS